MTSHSNLSGADFTFEAEAVDIALAIDGIDVAIRGKDREESLSKDIGHVHVGMWYGVDIYLQLA